MMMKRDIAHLDDVKFLVDSFYQKVLKDRLLGPVFEERINNNWIPHLEKMYRFWQTVLLEEHTYHGHPFAPHVGLPIDKKHFERWLALFGETLEENFEGERQQEAMWRARKMAEMFQIKLAYYRGGDISPIV